MKKIAIIGYGASTIGFLNGLIQTGKKDVEVTVFDQNPEEKAGGLGGLAYDGKLIISQNPEDLEQVSLQEQKKIVSYFLTEHDKAVFYKEYKIHKMDEPDPKAYSLIRRDYAKEIEAEEFSTEILSELAQKFYNNGMCLVSAEGGKTFHLGTDQLKMTNEAILRRIQSELGDLVQFCFDTQITPEKFDEIEEKYDMVILAVGRYGTTLVDYVTKKYPELLGGSFKVDIGVRIQIPSNLPNIKSLDQKFHEWKVKYKTSNNLEVRTFCHNPKGFVVTQLVDVLGEKVCIVNGHSKTNVKSKNTNFAILVTQKFTEPFNNPVLYGKSIAQQANLLAGSREKLILQTLGDFLKQKRTKHLFRVLPTLPKEQYILGDLSYVLPAKTYQAIKEFITKLAIVVPQVSIEDNLLYGIQTKFYGSKINNSDKIKFIGDCSGRSRSIVVANGTGRSLAKNICG